MFTERNLTVGLLCLVLLFSAQISRAQKTTEANLDEQKLSTAEAESGDAATGGGAAEKENSSEKKKKKKKDAEPEDYLLRRGEKEYSWEIGSSPFNPSNFAGPKEYDVYGRDLHLSTFRFGRVIGTKGPVTYQYLFGATPFAVFTKNEVRNPAFVSPTQTPRISPTMRKTSYGFGIQPLNFRFSFFPKSRLKPYAQVGAGILLTSRSVPVPRSTPFNFTGDFGGGFQYFTSRTRAVTVGYKYFHISNGNIGGKINNPGYNANVFYISYSFFHK